MTQVVKGAALTSCSGNNLGPHHWSLLLVSPLLHLIKNGGVLLDCLLSNMWCLWAFCLTCGEVYFIPLHYLSLNDCILLVFFRGTNFDGKKKKTLWFTRFLHELIFLELIGIEKWVITYFKKLTILYKSCLLGQLKVAMFSPSEMVNRMLNMNIIRVLLYPN